MNAPSPRAAVPLPAASILVLAPGPGGSRQVLMGLRGATHRFMPNRLVFPGGRIDAVDFAAPAASEPAGHVMARLMTGADARLARALTRAAARELEEETGLSLGTPPALDGFDYLCRAVTPSVSPIRFDARFFVVDAVRVSGTLAGDGELEELRYIGIADAMALDLAGVTRGVLDRLGEWLALGPDERAARTAVQTRDDRTWSEG